MLKRMLSMIGIVIAVFAVIGLLWFRHMQAQMAKYMAMKPAPAAVTTTVVKGRTWQPVLNAVGSLKAVNGVLVSTDLAGIVAEIAFESGKAVKKGDLLVKLDTRTEQAQLQSAQARLDLAKLSLNRKQDLLQKKAASQADYDAAEAEARQAQAAVNEALATIARKTIAAPFDGMLGIRQVNVGQYLSSGTAVVPLESMDPIYVEFSVPQQDLTQIALRKKIRLTAVGVGEKEFEGEITAINSLVDEANRNIQIEATVRNPEGVLRSGMFVKVEVLLPEKEGILAIPASAINYAPYGDSVFVVKEGKSKEGKPEKQAVQQFVKLGASRGDLIAVVHGLSEGDEIITSGVFKLRPNAPVQVNNTVKPGEEEKPQPPNT